ncbi:MAG: VCBS repeat-containing protein [Opitutaceae bacterium]|nr:VCBS repeat-containing protein [Opitutaceae bacterium]
MRRPSVPLITAGLLLLGATAGAAPVRFTEILVTADLTYPYGVAAADLDGDGDLDLTASDARGRNSLHWFENDGTGRFTRHLLHYQPPPGFLLERHRIADLNADGRPDVVIVENSSGDLRWLENPGPAAVRGEWPVRFITRAGDVMGAYDVEVGDLDGDGRPDVAASSWRKGNMFSWHRNPGPSDPPPAKWVQANIAENLLETRTVRLADVDGDGDLDVLGTAARAGLVLWLENPGRPTDLPWTQHYIDKAARACHGEAVDFDGDGDPDLVLASGFGADLVPSERNPIVPEVVWYENLGRGGEWRKHVVQQPFPQAFEAIAVDLDGDGDRDIAATAWHETPGAALAWFERTASGWTPHVIRQDWLRACQVIAADLNGDGRPDLVACAEGATRELRWWRNDGPAPGAP